MRREEPPACFGGKVLSTANGYCSSNGLQPTSLPRISGLGGTTAHFTSRQRRVSWQLDVENWRTGSWLLMAIV